MSAATTATPAPGSVWSGTSKQHRWTVEVISATPRAVLFVAKSAPGSHKGRRHRIGRAPFLQHFTPHQ